MFILYNRSPDNVKKVVEINNGILTLHHFGTQSNVTRNHNDRSPDIFAMNYDTSTLGQICAPFPDTQLDVTSSPNPLVSEDSFMTANGDHSDTPLSSNPNLPVPDTPASYIVNVNVNVDQMITCQSLSEVKVV